MRASAAASFCLSVAISAAAVTVRSTMIASVSRGRADRALHLSGLVKIFSDNAAFLRVIGLPASSAGNQAAVPRRLLRLPRSGQHGAAATYVGTVDEWLTAQPPGSRLAAVEI